MKKNWYTSKITLWIFVGLVLGIAVGLIGMINPEAFAAVSPAFDLVYNLYISALRMMIFPLVFCSIVMGIQGIGSVGKTAMMEYAIGDHVHFSVALNGDAVDPEEFLAQN